LKEEDAGLDGRISRLRLDDLYNKEGKGKVIPLQALCGSEGG